MNAVQWIILLAGTAGAAAFAYWIYLRQEVPVAGRPALAAARTGTVALLLLLILDPSIPGSTVSRGDAGTWVALDLSLSMDAASGDGERPWQRAVARARDLAGDGATVAGFGEGLRFLAEDPELLEHTPAASSTRLAPLLERAIEAGAAEVVVLSDLRVEDPVAVRALLERPGLSVRFEDVGGALPNAGVSRWDLPSAVEAEERVAGELAVYGSEESQGSTATVEIREGDRLVFTSEVQLPAPRLVTSVPFELPVASERGTVRYEARVRLTGDAFPDDDARVAYTDVDPEEGLLVALALSPDWELRFLIPILEQVTGLTTRGYVRVGPDRYLPTGGNAAQGPVGGDEVRRRVEAAEMVVLQGLSGDDPAWLKTAASSGRHVVVIPDDTPGAAAAGVSASAPQSGEWYVAPEIPSSSLAGDLAGLSVEGLPPLASLMTARQSDGEAPLRVRLRASGAAEPALLLLPSADGRRAVLLANGLWRWGFREGPSRDAYRRLWAAVAGWLLSDASLAGGPFLRPERRVAPRGQPLEWRAPALAGQEVRLVLSRADSTVLDSVMVVPSTGSLATPQIAPGSYRYLATSPARAGEEATGTFDVEAHTDELRHLPARDLMSVTVAESEEGGSGPGRRPLRTHPLPYFLLLGCLCGEWIGRRRQGLR